MEPDFYNCDVQNAIYNGFKEHFLRISYKMQIKAILKLKQHHQSQHLYFGLIL